MHLKKKRKARAYLVITLALLLLFLASGGFYGGMMLITDPSGNSLQVPTAFLEGLPIQTFLLPGLFVLSFFGILPVLAVYGIVFRRNAAFLEKINPLRVWKWPVTLSFAIGVILIGWTIGELLLWGMNSLSEVYLGFGAIIVLLSYLAAKEL